MDITIKRKNLGELTAIVLTDVKYYELVSGDIKYHEGTKPMINGDKKRTLAIVYPEDIYDDGLIRDDVLSIPIFDNDYDHIIVDGVVVAGEDDK